MYKVGIISEAYGTIPLIIPLTIPLEIPFAWKVPPLFLNPFYLLGVPPLHVVWFLSTLVPGCLCTDLPLPLPSPSSFPAPQRFPISNTYPPTTTLRHRLHIVRYRSDPFKCLSPLHYQPQLTLSVKWSLERWIDLKRLKNSLLCQQSHSCIDHPLKKCVVMASHQLGCYF